MELNMLKRKFDKPEKNLLSVQNAGIFQRLIALLVDLILIFFLHFTFSLAIITPISNQLGYEEVLVAYNNQLLEFHLGEYDDQGEFIIYNFDEIDDADLQAFYNDPEAKAISTQKFIFDFVQVSVGLLLAELIVMLLLPLLFKNGQTIGKKLMRLGLVDNYGIKIKPINVFMRFLIGWFVFETALSLISMMFFGLPVFILVSGVMALFTKNKRALHDIIGSTIVVNMDKMIIFNTVEERHIAIEEERKEKELQSNIE